MENYKLLRTNVLIIGGGAAGVRAAIEAEAEGSDVILTSKGPVSKSGLTPLAYPCFQAAVGAMDENDNPDVHYLDIVREGKGLADEDLARILADDAVARFIDLKKFGIKFETEDGKLFQSHYPGQTYPRNLLIVGGGFGLINGLKKELHKRSLVKILEDICIFSLLDDNGEVAGALGLNLRDGQFYVFEADSVVLACGGYEALWGNNDGSTDSTGDGITLAFRIGAEIIDLEMTQYYPGVFAHPESLKGVDIQYETFLDKKYMDFKLLNAEGKEFLPEGPLPGRDVLMRAIFKEIEEGRGTRHNAVYVDPNKSTKSKDEIEKWINHFVKNPNKFWKKNGIDVSKDIFEICPAVHYTLGGIRINNKSETTVPRLFAAGENSSNTHGANRIGGNSLAETQVFGEIAGKQASIMAKKIKSKGLNSNKINSNISIINALFNKKSDGIRPTTLMAELKKLMDDYVGPNRHEEGLKNAQKKVQDFKNYALPKIEVVEKNLIFNLDLLAAIQANMAIELADLIIKSALLRKESRGHHYRSDYLKTSKTPQHTLVKRINDEIVTSFAQVGKL